MKKILLTGGGTGGHIFPILAVAKEIKKMAREPIEFLLLGSKLKNVDLPYKNILTGKFRRYFSGYNLIDILKIPLGILQALWFVGRFRPDVIFGKGGYASVPAVIAGWFYGRPIIIHESDTIPGLANRFLACLANKICISFDKAREFFPEDKIVFTGNPIRQEILSVGAGFAPAQGQPRGLPLQKPIILILGGSQGAQRINELIIKILPQVLARAKVVHLTGRGQSSQVKFDNYQQFEFVEKIEDFYAQADIIISRAGANTLAEIAVLGKPSIIIPLPSSSANHQRENGSVFGQAQAAIVLDEDNLTPDILLKTIFKLLDDCQLRQKLTRNVKQLSRPDAGQNIAQEVLRLCSA